MPAASGSFARLRRSCSRRGSSCCQPEAAPAAAGAGGNGWSLLRKFTPTLQRSLNFEGSWRRHYTRSLDAQHFLIVCLQQVMQGLAIIRMYAAIVCGILVSNQLCCLLRGTLDAPCLRKSCQENFQAWPIHWATSRSRIYHNLDVRTLQQFRWTWSLDDWSIKQSIQLNQLEGLWLVLGFVCFVVLSCKRKLSSCVNNYILS